MFHFKVHGKLLSLHIKTVFSHYFRYWLILSYVFLHPIDHEAILSSFVDGLCSLLTDNLFHLAIQNMTLHLPLTYWLYYKEKEIQFHQKSALINFVMLISKDRGKTHWFPCHFGIIWQSDLVPLADEYKQNHVLEEHENPHWSKVVQLESIQRFGQQMYK